MAERSKHLPGIREIGLVGKSLDQVFAGFFFFANMFHHAGNLIMGLCWFVDLDEDFVAFFKFSVSTKCKAIGVDELPVFRFEL